MLSRAIEEIINKERLADKKSSEVKKKGRKSSCSGTQAERYGTFRADREKTF